MSTHASDIPKTLVRVAGHPFAHWQLSWLASQAVTDVVYLVGYRSRQVRSFVGDGRRWGLRITYSEELPDELLGTAGAIRQAIDSGCMKSAFFVLYGDSYLSVDLEEVERSYRSRGFSALLTVLENKGQWDRSNARYEHGLVTRYEKDADQNVDELTWIDYGLSVLEPQVIADAVDAGVASDLSDVFSNLSRSGALAGFPVGDRFFEVGSPAGLRALEAHLTRGATCG